ncbi:hypothetical protein RvY_06483 [Ramazzottius varieornatus]|uniref:LRRCT domain-containing protein n=1 Tax=Ramazzottius varieornatus TaxID=947166 RepID=A0A1D1UYS1_RAMVA|nr:hypothetical protein RvY_06483 [Ramazzottius varieornatus]
MRRIRVWAIFLLAFKLLYVNCSTTCPLACLCHTLNGKKQVRCEAGGTTLSQKFISNSDRDIAVLFISGSKDNLNTFNLSTAIFQSTSFEEVHLSFSSLNYLPDSIFSPVSNTLRVLNLSSNNFQDIQKEVFLGLSRLTHLHLDGNILTSLTLSAFSYLSSLKVLTLSSNLISDVIQENAPLDNLEFLDLSFNLIGDPVGPQSTLSQIFFTNMPMLTVLNLTSNNVRSLPWEALDRHNRQLSELYLGYNKLQTIQPYQLSVLHSLKRVSLRGNPLRFISDEAFRGLHLDFLDLSGLPASVLDADLFVGARIKELDVSNMKLHAFRQETFRPIAANLQALNVSENRGLRVHSGMFRQFTSLKRLFMTHMPTSTLPPILGDNHNVIEELHLSHNGLVHLPDGLFPSLPNLRRLNLSHNRLQRVPHLAELKEIREIDLSGNRLAFLSEETIKAFSQSTSLLRSLKLTENPWDCDCKRVAPLRRWVSLGFDSFGRETVCMDAEGKINCPVCSLPASLRGTPINNISADALSSCDSDL